MVHLARLRAATLLSGALAALSAVGCARAAAQVRRVAEMTAADLRRLDRARTVVILPGGILEEHGGRLSVQSRPGETTFTIELPVTRAPEPAPPAPPRRLAPSGTGRVALVVEDEPSVLDLVVTLLSQQGWRVDMASGGRTGLECVERRSYDLIVSDIRMPDGDGQEFYRNVLAREPALARRFIFITGDTANPDGWRFLENSGVPVIEKPFPPATFEEAVARVIAAAARPQ